MEKTVTTLGEIFAANAKRLAQGRLPHISWLELLRPVMVRAASPQISGPARFRRSEALPRARAIIPVAGSPPSEGENEEIAEAGMPLPLPVRERLRTILGTGVERVRVHADQRADDLARRHHADAVTVGRDIHLRSGVLERGGPAGLALLAHEATHVLEAMRPGAAWRRATEAGVREEEALALGRERAVREMNLPAVPPPSPSLRAPAPAPSAPQSSPLQRPMKADEDRQLPSPQTRGDSAANDLDAMRRDLFRDLMSQIRVEFERGA